MRGSTISSLFIFNPNLKPAIENPTEDDYKNSKIIYYYPETAQLFEQQTHVGLAEGMCMFVQQFSSNPLESIHTEKHTHIIYQCEPSIWLCIVLSHPPSTDTFIKQQDLETHPHLIKSIAEGYYKNFYLFHGTITSFQYPGDYLMLKDILNDYTNVFLDEQVKKNEIFEGFSYCALDRKSYMSVMYGLSQLSFNYSDILHTMLIYEGSIVNTSMPQQSSLIIYSYLSRDKNWRRLADMKRDLSSQGCQYGRIAEYPKKGFLYGKTASGVHIPTIMLPELEPVKLVVWAYDTMQIVLLLKNQDTSDDLLENIRQTLNELSPDMAKTIGSQVQRIGTPEDSFKFLYFNSMNLAIKQSTKLNPIDDHLYRLILTLSAQMKESSQKYDSLVKTIVRTNTAWVMVVKVLDSREIYFVLPPSAGPVNKIEEDVVKFANNYFHNIFTGL
jgi:First Longin domain of INTU, CCZ1 and HPS4/Intu longin-like domain 3